MSKIKMTTIQPLCALLLAIFLLVTTSASAIYRYTDDKGVVHIVDDEGSIPAKYRKGASSQGGTSGPSNVTPVMIQGNRVIVPVTLSHGGSSVVAHLVLDTGASITVITEQLAQRLNFRPGETRAITARVADGRTVQGSATRIGSMTVGPYFVSGPVISIITMSSPIQGQDGLLGMDFLRDHRFHVDFTNQ